MSIFNSLGSNYSLLFVLQNLFATGSSSRRQELERELGDHYGGTVTLTYKGREAISLALERSGLPKGSVVGVNGFTCYALYHAVETAGYTPLLIDIAAGELHFGPRQLEAANQSQPAMRAVIIQNTLGYPVDMPAIHDYCQGHELVLIEDLAHSIGTQYSDQTEAGLMGDFTMLSFSQDKTIDVVAGGALVDRRQTVNRDNSVDLPLVSIGQRCKNRFYPFFSGLIRLLYPIKLGRLLHYGLKRLKLMATPMSEGLSGTHAMTPSTTSILLPYWQKKESIVSHRRDIAAIYQQELDKNIQYNAHHGTPNYLRFPIRIENRDKLLVYLKARHIYIGDTWYDAPIAPPRCMSKTNYVMGSCPEAEILSRQIMNLPTHRYVTAEKARYICATIKQWQAISQSGK